MRPALSGGATLNYSSPCVASQRQTSTLNPKPSPIGHQKHSSYKPQITIGGQIFAVFGPFLRNAQMLQKHLRIAGIAPVGGPIVLGVFGEIIAIHGCGFAVPNAPI